MSRKKGDGLLGLGSSLDFVTPAVAFERDGIEMVSGDIVDFAIASDTGFLDWQIKSGLSALGVSSWGWMISMEGWQMFTVHRRNISTVASFLGAHGIPIINYPRAESQGCVERIGKVVVFVLITVFLFYVLPQLLW